MSRRPMITFLLVLAASIAALRAAGRRHAGGRPGGGARGGRGGDVRRPRRGLRCAGPAVRGRDGRPPGDRVRGVDGRGAGLDTGEAGARGAGSTSSSCRRRAWTGSPSGVWSGPRRGSTWPPRRSGWRCARGAPLPDVSTPEAFVETLLAAESIGYSASVSGTYVSTELFPRLGVAEELAPRSRRIVSERVAAVVGARRGRDRVPAGQRDTLHRGRGLRRPPSPPSTSGSRTFSAGIAGGRRQPGRRAAAHRLPGVRGGGPDDRGVGARAGGESAH